MFVKMFIVVSRAFLRGLGDALYRLFTKKKLSDRERFNKYARIDIVAGKTGQGKTTFAVWEAIQMQKLFPNIRIISNINVEGWIPLTRENLLVPYDGPCLVIIDESNTTFPAKIKSEVDDELRSRLTQIRKGFGTRVLALTQDYAMLDTNFRRLAHYVYLCNTYWGRASVGRRYRQEDYENYSNNGGLNIFDGKKMKIKRISSWYYQTDRLREKYDYKEKVDAYWFRS